MSFKSSFEKTAVSRQWISDKIDSGQLSRMVAFDKRLSEIKDPKKHEALKSKMEAATGRITSRDKVLKNPNLSDKNFRSIARKHVGELRSAHPMRDVKPKAHGKHMKALIGGAALLGAAGGTAAYLKHKNSKKKD